MLLAWKSHLKPLSFMGHGIGSHGEAFTLLLMDGVNNTFFFRIPPSLLVERPLLQPTAYIQWIKNFCMTKAFCFSYQNMSNSSFCGHPYHRNNNQPACLVTSRPPLQLTLLLLASSFFCLHDSANTGNILTHLRALNNHCIYYEMLS